MEAGCGLDTPSHRPPLSRRAPWVGGMSLAACLVVAGALLHDAGPFKPGARVALARMGTGADVYQELRVDSGGRSARTATTQDSGAPASAPPGKAAATHAAAVQPATRGRGWKADPDQKNLELWRHDMSREEWPSFGKRGSAMGSIRTPKVSSLVQRAAEDCGQDPDCSCDWAGMPRECLYNYCCGTIAHNLGQGRADYGTDALGVAANPTPEQRVDAFRQARHLEAWQGICTPDQDLYGTKCSSEGVPLHDNRKHR